MVASPRIAVLMTCHNRRALTLQCLELLAGQAHFRADDLYLVDDGSDDGTGDAVRAAYPQAHVIAADGSLFWNGGMRLAWDRAKAASTQYDFYLWLNDDTQLFDGTLAALVSAADDAAPRGQAVIAVAATHAEGQPDRLTYSGHRIANPARPLRMALLPPAERAQPIDTFSGNIVLVSAAAEEQLGNLYPGFEHIYGDLDYGLRAGHAGIPMVLMGGFGGACDGHEQRGNSLDPQLSRFARLRLRLREDKKIHARDWRSFVRLHDGAWHRRIAYSLSPYLRIALARPHPAGRPANDRPEG